MTRSKILVHLTVSCFLFLSFLVRGDIDEKCAADSSSPSTECGCSALKRPASSADAHDRTSTPHAGTAQSYSKIDEHNDDMVEVPPGVFHMGERKEKMHFKQDGEGPLRYVRMSGFRIDRHEVSNAKFSDFVADTGYLTDAERLGDSFVHESYITEEVSNRIDKKVAAVPWWLPVDNATWKRPEGFDSALNGTASRFGERWQHPVVHMSWNDADAYCRWRNASLPTEAQWEYAARGGLSQQLYPWGDSLHGKPKRHRMNIWQGKFPHENTAKDGYSKTAPVDAFGEQNAWGLFNMVGNVWEWTSDWFTPVHFLNEENQKTGYIDPMGPSVEELAYLEEIGYLKPETPGTYEKVKKGGSFMCHKSYCWRYRICARSHLTTDSSAHHTGMRCVRPAADEWAAHWSRHEIPPKEIDGKHGVKRVASDDPIGQ